jgi:hypothetical protein
MTEFFTGLCLLLLGAGIHYFSRMFGLYRAQREEDGVPFPYLVLLALSLGLAAAGAAFLALSLL